MSNEYTIFAVDDDDTMRLLLESLLGDSYAVETFCSGEGCLARLKDKLPNMFLLDVGLPGIQGHDLCRQIRRDAPVQGIPVVFISSCDDLDSMMAGYDAGGDDYVVKPFDVAILKRKIEKIRRMDNDRQALLGIARSSDELATLALANLDEYAGLIQFLRALNDCENPRTLPNLLLDLLRGYRLQTAIQVRLPGFELTLSDQGENRPFEVGVINHVRSMDRIIQFKTRAAYNFEHITILVNNMPVHNPELCGRLRDHLAIAAETAEAKLQAQITKAENAQAKTAAAELLDELQSAVVEFEKNYHHARYRGSVLTHDLLNELAQAFASLGLSEEQEIRIDSIVRKKTRELAKIYDFSDQTQATLSEIASRTAEILRPSATTAMDMGEESGLDASARIQAAVELF